MQRVRCDAEGGALAKGLPLGWREILGFDPEVAPKSNSIKSICK